MDCQYTELQEEALLHIIGPDALSFLQGQVTCDTRALSAAQALPGAYCTPRGRVVCDFLLCRLGEEHFALRMRRDIRAAAAAVLARYIIFSKAQLQAERDDWQVLGCSGPDAFRALSDIFGEVPRVRYQTCGGDGYLLIQLDEAGQQFECILDTASGASLLAQVQGIMPGGASSDWQALQIRSGIARIQSATSGEFIPQMLNYDITGHISFSKGCYTGQEVVARMHYRGKPKRRLYLATLETTGAQPDALPEAGAPLFSAGSAQSAGTIVNCVACGDNLLLALVIATADGVAAGLHCGVPEGPSLTIGELPYRVSTD